MAEPIYKFFMGKPTEAWYVQTPERQQELLAAVNRALENAGGRRVVMADSSWSSEEYTFFGVEEFPDIAAVQRFQAALNEFDWTRYTTGITTLGTRFAGEEAQGAIYHAFVGRMTEAWYALGKSGQDELWNQLTAAEAEAGAQFVVVCDSTWCSERHQFFGVATYPHVAARQQAGKAYDALNWMRYVDAITVLGAPIDS
jgi:uncharacterized protein with GYD domain